MEFRTYTIAGKQVKVTDKRILDIVNKAEGMESLDKFNDASQELKEYLLGETSKKHLSLNQYSANVGLWEAIMVQSIRPLGERYAEKFHLSGRFTPEDKEMKRRFLLKMSSGKYVNRTDRPAKTENPWDNKKMKKFSDR